MIRLTRALLTGFVVVTAVLGSLGSTSLAADEVTPVAETAPALWLEPGADGAALVWGSGLLDLGQGAVEPDADGLVPVAWDLTALDLGGFRSDLLRIELLDVEGPGRLSLVAPTRHGGAVTVLDSENPEAVAVLQLGRHGTARWNASVAGDYRFTLRATVPTADGQVAVVDGVHELRSAPAGLADLGIVRSGPAAAVPQPNAAPPAGDLESPAVVLSQSTSAAAATSTAAASGERVVISDGHVDMGPRLIDGTWRVQVKDDRTSPAVWRELADVVLHVTGAAATTIPANPSYGFLGEPGASIFVLPQSQRSGVVWPGWNTQDPGVQERVPGPVTWNLRGVDGPGRLVIYTTDSFGENQVLLDSSGPQPQRLDIAPNTHAHANWAFTSTGTYRVTVEMVATLDDGTAVSDTRILTITVGDDVDPGNEFTPDPGPSAPVGPGSDGGGGVDDSITITTSQGDGAPSKGSGSRGGSLPITGSQGVTGLVALGVALIVVGAVLRRLRRRHG
jgi:surface-anchored protein/LPXTG-motif cell wall-anchored protein